MDHYGWAERFAMNMADGQSLRFSPGTRQDSASFLEFTSVINQSMRFSPDGSHAGENSYLASHFVQVFLNSNYTDLAKHYLEITLKEAEKKSDILSCANLCIDAIKVFNKFFHHQYAADLLLKIKQSYADAIPRFTKPQLFNFYIESGNTNRYRLLWDTALDDFEHAKAMLADGPVYADPETEREAFKISSRNLAVMNRDLGAVPQSLQILEQLIIDFPDDDGITANIATLYLKVKQPKSALNYLQPLLSKTHAVFETNLPVRLAAIQANFMLGNNDNVLADLAILFRDWDKMSKELQLQLLNMTLQLGPALIETNLRDWTVFDKAEELLFDKACSSPLKHSTFCYLVLKKLEQNKLMDAQVIYQKYSEEIPLYSDYWEFNHFLLVYHYRMENYREAKGYFDL